MGIDELPPVTSAHRSTSRGSLTVLVPARHLCEWPDTMNQGNHESIPRHSENRSSKIGPRICPWAQVRRLSYWHILYVLWEAIALTLSFKQEEFCVDKA